MPASAGARVSASVSANVSDRLRALDLVRGVAVLGILAINITGFAAPESATYSPNLPAPGTLWDNWAYALTFMLFEGKMRALFSILFGASLLLFVERADAAGKPGAALQLRRLLWLALIGYLHFVFLWDGDILFLYAVTGISALGLRRLLPVHAAVAGVLVLIVWQTAMTASWYPAARAEARVAAGIASTTQVAFLREITAAERANDRTDVAEAQAAFADQAQTRLTARGDYPLTLAAFAWGEIFGYVLIGMALLGSGFFAGQWQQRTIGQMTVGGLMLGGIPTAAYTLWAAIHGFPELAQHLAIGGALTFAHLLIGLAYAGFVMLAAPRILASPWGRAIEDAGRMALTNYIGTSLVMGAIFAGWGLGWFGRFGAAVQWGFVLLGWAMMLGVSRWWLARFRQGPLEWLWRSLTEWRYLPNRCRLA